MPVILNIGPIEIDFSPIPEFFALAGARGPLYAIYILIIHYYGWVVLLYLFLKYVVWHEYIEHIQHAWAHHQEFVMLAIDVPRENEKSVQAMEEFFIHLLGAHGSTTKYEKYIEGKFQLSFSFELVSIDGHIQYLIRTPKAGRDLVESGIYAQFPDAEVTEVEDYTTAVPQTWPNPTHDLWGVEFVLDNTPWYPIRTYKKFEDQRTGDYIDPLAALLESMSKIGAGEQMWLQILAEPQGPDWTKGAEKELANYKAKAKPHPSMLSTVLGAVEAELSFAAQQAVGIGAPAAAAKSDDKALSPLLTMTPGERDRLKALEEKISKLAYSCKIRYCYVAEKKVMNKSRGVNPVIGAIKQFGAVGINGFKPALKQTGTRANYLFVEQRLNWRKTNIFNGYKNRSGHVGIHGYPLNVEELASIWHFPTIYIKTPTISTTKLKKSEAPIGTLPYEVAAQPGHEEKKKTPLVTAPIEIDLDDDSFEHRFAVHKEQFAADSAERTKRLEERAQTPAAPAPVIADHAADLQHAVPEPAAPAVVTPVPDDESAHRGQAPDNLPF